MSSLGSSPAAFHRIVATLSLVLLALAVAAPAYVVGHFAVDVPLDDEWAWIPMHVEFRDGTLSFERLFALHNEHRMLVPGAASLALTVFGGWDVARECVAGLVLSLAGFFAWMGTLRRLLPRADVLPVAAASALLVFSLAQFQNWLWGFQFAWFLIGACVLGSTYIMAVARGTWRDVAWFAALSVLASFSSAQGLLLAPAIGVAATFSRSFDLRKGAAWWLFVALVYVAYFYGFHRPHDSPDPGAAVRAPLDTFQYFQGYIGNPLAGELGRIPARIAGILGLLGTLVVACMLPAMRDTERVRLAAVCLLLLTYALLGGIVIAFARSGLGIDQGLASRYVATCAPLWLALVLALASVRGRLRIAAVVGIVAIASLALSDAVASRGDLEAYAQRERDAAFVLDHIANEPDRALSLLYPVPGVPRVYAPLWRSLR